MNGAARLEPPAPGHPERADTMGTNSIRLRFTDSAEVFTAPAGYSLVEALEWIGRCNHPTINRREQVSPTCYVLHNGRRGHARRSCVVHVEVAS